MLRPRIQEAGPPSWLLCWGAGGVWLVQERH